MPIVTTVLDAELGTKLWIGLKGTTVWTAYFRCPFAFHFSMHEDRNKFLSGFVPRTGRVALEKELFDLPTLGFGPQELDRILSDLEPESLVNEDDVPRTPALAVTVAGDVVVMGRHRLLCGDATQSESFARVLEGRLADMVFTDPPYNVHYTQTSRNQVRQIVNDDLGPQFEQFLHAACVQILTASRGAVYLCM